MKQTAPPGWRETSVHGAGLRIAAFACGSEDPDAATVVLLHGLGHWSDAAWGRLIPYLDPRMRYVAFDLPGFGASEKPDAVYDVGFFANALDDAFNRLGLKRFRLIGHSLGGYVAAHYAGAMPERIERLGLIAPAGFAHPARFVVYALAGGWARWAFTRRPSRRFVTHMLRRSVMDFSSIDAPTLQRTLELAADVRVRRAFAGVYAGAIRAFARRRELHAGFARYTGPVFCAWGRHDRFLRVAALRDVLRTYPHAETLVLERSGHLPMVEQPAEVGAALRAFLA